MAHYNPHSPRIIGNEFVGIRDESLEFNPLANSLERGYGFTLGSARNVAQARYYINTFPDSFAQDNAYTASIYPRGKENESGPVHSVIIPCNYGIVTGNTSDSPSWVFSGGATTVAEAFWNPSAETNISYRYGRLYDSNTYVFFAVNQYANLLYNKRILGVNLLMGVDGGFSFFGGVVEGSTPMQLFLANDFCIINSGSNAQVRYPDIWTPTTPGTDIRLDRIKLGDVSRYYGITGNADTVTNTNISQWTYTELQRFEASNANRINMHIRSPLIGVDSGWEFVLITYMALEVFYCEESRVGYGSRLIGFTDFSTSPRNPYNLGANTIPIRNTAGGGLILQPGDYTVTVNQSNLGDSYNGLRTARSGPPELNELRALYEVPSVPGVQVNLPYPLNDETLGSTITRESTLLIPQVSLHASGSGGTLYESHGYGRQTLGEVWTGATTSQRIDTSWVGGTASYPWLRYWARRFGNTTGSLVATSGASTASITVADFDALDEVLDGWRQVDLRWDTPLSLTSGVYPIITWSPSTTTSAGNRWEILGVAAPAITGVPGNQLNLVPSPNTLTLTTYGQPVSGGLISETWLPQLGPYVSGSTVDQTADVSFLLAQDLFPVTGFAALQLSQSITGIGLDCGLNPDYIPSALTYVRLTWSATSSSVPVTGFGYYEVQRSDTLTDWQTIAKMTSPAATGFTDYEARIGILTSYRIRAVDVYGFYNAWSSTITTTLTAPGVTGTSIVADTHVLVFTSNASQAGAYNLAYCLAWDGTPIENFTLPEGSSVQLQPMFDRNFYTAFHTLERGGEQFAREILVQAAAISPETLADFTSLRSMAWASVPYICVRDEDGNRWFANVSVPSVRVQLNRTIYRAAIQITEVTDTAAEIEI